MINEVDLRDLWKDLDEYESELSKESKLLQEVWIKIADIKNKNDSEMDKILKSPEFTFRSPSEVVVFNVGGQLFEVTVNILIKDPYSVLASVCRVDSAIKSNEDGFIYFDRDWWLFRHIISFLRSNTLPNELETLKELYTEASFYRLQSLQKAIENIPVHQLSNLTPQINHVVDSGPHAMYRPHDAFVLDSSLYRSFQSEK
eukprot:gene5205-7243_t